MGRRALRKIDPSLDLSGQLKSFDDLPNPWDTGALFGKAAPLEIEVGSGKGLFMEHACGAHPERNFLGIEVAGKYARYCAARLVKHRLRNGIMVHADALRVFRERLADACAQAVHVYFPDPWWKKRHHKRRVMTAPFLRDIERVLSPSGTLHFWTDVEAYYHESLALIAQHTQLAGPQAVPEAPPAHDLDYRTHFERRKRQEGLPIFRARFAKSAHTAVGARAE